MAGLFRRLGLGPGLWKAELEGLGLLSHFQAWLAGEASELLARAAAPGLREASLQAPGLLSRIHTSSSAETSETLLHTLEVGGEGSALPPSTACVIHGLLGAAKNLQTFSKQLCERAEDSGGRPWRAVMVDQRCHGRSARLRLHPPHNIQASARDVINLFSVRGVSPEVVIGHSMGGKVALEYVRQLSAAPGKLELPKQVWVLDAKPGIVDAHSGGAVREVGRVLRAVQSVPLPVPSRQWLANHFHQQGFSPGVTQWLGSNLHYEGKDRYVWTFDVHGALQMFDSYCNSDYFPLLRSPPEGVTINLLRAAQSDRWDPASVQVGPSVMQALQDAVASTAKAPSGCGRTRYFELPNAGHWVHVDNLPGLLDLVVPTLQEI